MALLNLRNLLSIAAGVSASAMAVRKVLGREVDKRTDRMIAEVADQARIEIRQTAHTFFSEGFLLFFWTLVVKITLVLFVAALFFSGWIEHQWSAIALAALFLCFAVYDFIRAFPTLKFLSGELRRYGWRPRRILAETISAQVFENILEKAKDLPVDHTQNILITLAGRKRSEVVEKIAKAVAEIASETSWIDIKPLLMGFAVRWVSLFVLYSGLVLALVWFVRQS